ncbi:MAG: periplasmic heavy metal sensor [Deltaproteobacteria bacterium]|nr:periplasmic heavy metal sensor [Deltaproteobacteria bacterium]
MKKTIIIGLALTLALALIGTAALAWGPGFGRGFGAGPGSGYPAIPNLTAEQSAQIKALQEAFFKETEPLQKEMAEKVNNLRAEVQKVLTPEQLAQLPTVGPGRGFGPAAGFGPPMMGPRGRW